MGKYAQQMPHTYITFCQSIPHCPYSHKCSAPSISRDSSLRKSIMFISYTQSHRPCAVDRPCPVCPLLPKPSRPYVHHPSPSPQNPTPTEPKKPTPSSMECPQPLARASSLKCPS
ncbi:hypothetical protein B0T18DRAFT_402013 [Schizothecium vesticola]|uniref:Uncharacterized protein n=1 Tax=Schizothecium vesticola TaxID=314040 RepID=A0AA40K9N4_9PEZI|nr:hypothetical protein B0T18DRAFT_402013 [Schizothecium vesticola]